MKWFGLPAIFAALVSAGAGGPSATPVAVTSDLVYRSIHPHLLFSEADIPVLYAKVRDGFVDDQAYQFIRNRVDNVYASQSLVELLDDDYGLEQFLNLGLATYLETPYDTTARDRGCDLTLLLADSFAVDTDVYASSLRLRNLVIGYDLFMYDASEAERVRVRDEVESYVVYMITSPDYEIWHHRPYVSNKTAMIAAALGMAAVGMNVELDASMSATAMAEADDFVDDWMSAHLEIGGCYREGLLYGLWSMRHLVYYFEARRRFDGYDYSQVPAIRNMAEWLVYEMDPRGQGHTNNLQDCTDFFRPLSRHNTYLDWAQTRWGSEWGGYLYLHGPGGFGVDLGDHSDKAATVLWGQTFTATDPGLTLAPNRMWPGRGLYYYRTGWPLLFNSDDVVFSFYSGVFHGGHAQEDQNQFTLTGYGEKLVTDHGAGSTAKESEAHNLVLIDGAGQHNAGLSIGTDGDVAAYIVGDYIDCVTGDATQAYTTYSPYNENDTPYPGIIWSWGHTGANPVNFALRTVMTVHEAETPPYFVVADDIEKDGMVHGYEWRLHTSEENAVDAGANPVRITGNDGAMDVYVANPCFDSLSAGVSYFDNGSEDDNSNVLSLTRDAVNPHFVTILLPRSAASSAPVISTTRSETGTSTTIDWGTGYTDVVLTRASDGCLGQPSPPMGAMASPQPVLSDAKYAIARMDASSVLRYAIVEGTTFWWGGIQRLLVIDGPASITHSDNAIYIDRLNADFVIYSPVDVPVYFHDVLIPTTRAGDYLFSAAASGIADRAPDADVLGVRAFPNPFNPDVTIALRVEAPADAVADVYDVTGRRVARVYSGVLAAGENLISWHGVDDRGAPLPSGVYFLRVVADGRTQIRKLTLLK